jgi:hypothetical protein
MLEELPYRYKGRWDEGNSNNGKDFDHASFVGGFLRKLQDCNTATG